MFAHVFFPLFLTVIKQKQKNIFPSHIYDNPVASVKKKNKVVFFNPKKYFICHMHER